MVYLLRTTFTLIKEYGAVGFGVANFILVIWFARLLICNHLFHIQKSLNENSAAIAEIGKDVKKNTERICTIEGELTNK